MPKIRCHYEDCEFLDEGFCSAALIELDPDKGCITYTPSADSIPEEPWDNDDEEEEGEKMEDISHHIDMKVIGLHYIDLYLAIFIAFATFCIDEFASLRVVIINILVTNSGVPETRINKNSKNYPVVADYIHIWKVIHSLLIDILFPEGWIGKR